MEKELLLRLLDLAYEISNKTKADVFLDYAPHVNSFSLRYYKAGWEEEAGEGVYIATSEWITIENLQSAIERLEQLKTEVEEND